MKSQSESRLVELWSSSGDGLTIWVEPRPDWRRSEVDGSERDRPTPCRGTKMWMMMMAFNKLIDIAKQYNNMIHGSRFLDCVRLVACTALINYLDAISTHYEFSISKLMRSNSLNIKNKCNK